MDVPHYSGVKMYPEHRSFVFHQIASFSWLQIFYHFFLCNYQGYFHSRLQKSKLSRSALQPALYWVFHKILWKLIILQIAADVEVPYFKDAWHGTDN